jgi:hypothetical protein
VKPSLHAGSARHSWTHCACDHWIYAAMAYVLPRLLAANKNSVLPSSHSTKSLGILYEQQFGVAGLVTYMYHVWLIQPSQSAVLMQQGGGCYAALLMLLRRAYALHGAMPVQTCLGRLDCGVPAQ